MAIGKISLKRLTLDHCNPDHIREQALYKYFLLKDIELLKLNSWYVENSLVAHKTCTQENNGNGKTLDNKEPVVGVEPTTC
jgi:hypothetical protein